MEQNDTNEQTLPTFSNPIRSELVRFMSRYPQCIVERHAGSNELRRQIDNRVVGDPFEPTGPTLMEAQRRGMYLFLWIKHRLIARDECTTY
jgi:hypothetical protein